MILIKVGGGEHANVTGIVNDIKNLNQPAVFVHGASVQRDQLAEKLGVPTKRIVSPSGQVSVLTDAKALEVLTMAYAGLVNKQWVAAFLRQNINAVGLSGADGRLLEGRRKKHLIAVENSKQKLISDTYTGKVTRVNTDLIRLLLKNHYLPIITQPAISQQGELINTDNDRNLGVLAGALGIKEIIVLFEAPGFLRDLDDPGSLLKTMKHDQIDQYLRFAQGTMKKKLLGAKEAFALGVTKIYWGDSRLDQPIKTALEGTGTVIA